MKGPLIKKMMEWLWLILLPLLTYGALDQGDQAVLETLSVSFGESFREEFTGDDYCLVHGVVCNSTNQTEIQRVIELNLGDRKLQGTLPSIIGQLDNLVKLNISSNFLLGQIPDEILSIQTLQYLFISSNYFDCPLKDIQIRISDFELSKIQCLYSCPNEQLNHTNWNETQSYENEGTCKEGYSGSPTRKCLREGVLRIWDQEVFGSCQAIPISIRTRKYWPWFFVPIFCFFYLLLVLIFPFISKKFTKMNQQFKDNFSKWTPILTFPIFCICFISDIVFTINIAEKFPQHYVASIFFLIFLFVYNACVIAHLIHLFKRVNKKWRESRWLISLASLFSLFGISNLKLLSLFKDLNLHFSKGFSQKVETFTNGGLLFHHLPMLSITAATLPHAHYPFSALICFLLHLAWLLYGIMDEIIKWFQQITAQYDRDQGEDDQENIHLEDLQGPSQNLQRAPSQTDILHENKSLYSFNLIFGVSLLPFILISFIPHFIIGFGGPFALFSLQRFFLIFRRTEPKNNLFTLKWFQHRGIFLIPLNLVGLFTIGLILFPVAFILGAVVSIIGLCIFPFNREFPSKLFENYWQSFHFSFSRMLWCYLYFLEDPPELVRIQVFTSTRTKIHTWVLVLVTIYFSLFDLLLPLLDIIMNFVFSVKIFLRDQDFTMDHHYTLNSLMIVSFFASGSGLLLQVISYSYLVYDKAFQKSDLKFPHFALHHVGFGSSTPTLKYGTLKFCCCLLQDLLQLIVLFNVVDFIERATPLWTITFVFSLLSFSNSISRFIAVNVYAKNHLKRSKFGIYFWNFIVIIIISALCTLSLSQNQFCSWSKSIQSSAELTQISNCHQLGFPLQVDSLRVETPVYMNTLTFNHSIQYSSNHFTPLLDFKSLTTIPSSSIIEIIENVDLNSVSFSRLQFIENSGKLLLDNNSKLGNISLPLLTSINGNLKISLSEVNQFSIPSLVSLQEVGEIEIVTNYDLETILFPSLFHSPGQLTISDNSNLIEIKFTSLKVLEGSLSISTNPSLQYLDLDVYELNYLQFYNNSAIKEISFDNLEQITKGIVLSSNQNLISFTLPNLNLLSGKLEIRRNSQLQNLSIPLLTTFAGFSVTIISENSNLKTISLPNLSNIGFNPKFLLIHDNPQLTFVNLSSISVTSLDHISLQGNPSLTSIQFQDMLWEPFSTTTTTL